MNEQRRYYFCVFALMMLALLISCGTSNSETPVTVIATKVSVPMETKQTTVTPTASQILVSPTASMEPTFAYWATAQQVRFDAEYTRVAETKQAISIFVKQYPQMCGFQLEGVFISADGEWIASDCKFDVGGFRVFQTHGSLVWDIPYSKIFPYYPDFVGGVQPLHWSVDGNYLYLATWSCCPDIDSMGNGNDLYRLNLKTGNWELMITGNFHYYSFSPDGRKLAYTPNNQMDADNSVTIHILDLDTNKEELIYLGNFEQASVITWKQDGTQLVLIAQNGSLYSDNRKFALIVADLQKKRAYIVIPLGEDGLGIKAWSDNDVLTISRSNVMEYNGYYVNVFDTVYYDLEINQFVTPAIVP